MADNPTMTTVMENLEAGLVTDPNVTKFAPSKYRTPSTLAQTTSDMKRIIMDMQRAHEEYARQMKQHWDELLRIIG